MRLTHFGHSAVLVEAAGQRILIDPGNFSEGWRGLSELTAIVVTHQHGDHADPEHLPVLITNNPGARIIVEPTVCGLVQLPDGTTQLRPGDRVQLGGLTLQGVGGQHAVIHADYPQVPNVGVLLRAEGEPVVFHPGDALDTAPEGVDVLLVPAFGPWAALKETVQFVRAVDAKAGFLIHDGLLNDRGYGLIKTHLGRLTKLQLTDVRDPRPWYPDL